MFRIRGRGLFSKRTKRKKNKGRGLISIRTKKKKNKERGPLTTKYSLLTIDL